MPENIIATLDDTYSCLECHEVFKSGGKIFTHFIRDRELCLVGISCVGSFCRIDEEYILCSVEQPVWYK